MTSPTTAIWVAVAVAVALPTHAWCQSESVSRAYDCMALTFRVEDELGPSLELDSPSGFGGGGTTIGRGVDDDGNITIDGIAALIQDNVDSGTWENERQVLTRGSTVVVIAPPETQAKVAAQLAWLRATHARPIVLELSHYQAPAAELEAILAGGSVLDAARADALDQAPWTRTVATRLVSRSNQRVHAARVTHQAYLKDVDVEVADGAHMFDVEIGQLPLGTVDEVRAARADGGHGIVVDFRHTRCSGPPSIPTFDTGLRAMSGQPLKPLELPIQSVRRVRNALWIPAGGRAIAAADRVGDEARVLVVRHVDRPVEKLEAPKGDGKRMMRIYDVRYLLFEPPDFSARGFMPSMASSGGGGVGGAIFDTGEESVRLDADTLVEMIRSDIDEDSWHNDRNRLASIGGHLIVYQTPETLAKLETFLAELQRVRSVSVLVRSRVIAAADREAEGALVAMAGEPLSAEARADLSARIAAGGGLSVVSDLSTAALPGQRVHIGFHDNVTYLKDYDVEIAGKSGQHDPELGLIQAGALLDVRPTLTHSRDEVMLELRLAESALRSVDTRELSDGVRLQVPSVERSARYVTIVVPNGGSALIGLGSGRYAQVEVVVSRERKD